MGGVECVRRACCGDPLGAFSRVRAEHAVLGERSERSELLFWEHRGKLTDLRRAARDISPVSSLSWSRISSRTSVFFTSKPSARIATFSSW